MSCIRKQIKKTYFSVVVYMLCLTQIIMHFVALVTYTLAMNRNTSVVPANVSMSIQLAIVAKVGVGV